MDREQASDEGIHSAPVRSRQAQKEPDRRHGMFGSQVFERDPFCYAFEMSVETQSKQKSRMAIAKLLRGLVVQDPR